MLDVPIVIIAFRRPALTRLVLERVRDVRPSKLFVVADGPRDSHPEDIEATSATREVLNQIDWACEVRRNYSERNLGCGRRPATGISWVFRHVERAIILEDDCLPDPSFFNFCAEVLERYADVPQVMHVNGNTFGLDQREWHDYSYGFGAYPQAWGWATWKRAWKYFDYNIRSWPEFRDAGLLDSLDGGSKFADLRAARWEAVYGGKDPDIWDYQWQYEVMRRGGLSVVPSRNLVSNIGFQEDATHTTNSKSHKANLASSSISFPLKHPRFLLDDQRINRVYRENMLRAPLAARVVRKMRQHSQVVSYIHRVRD